jgi:hypothetical protein
MSNPERLAQLEADLARDSARIEEIDRLESCLPQRIPEEGVRAVAEGIRFRSERRMLEDRIYKTRILLVATGQ